MPELTAGLSNRVHAIVAMRLVTVLVLCLCALSLTGLVFTLFMPLARDQGIFAWIGATIANGGYQYTDAWDVKGPLVGLVYALQVKAFGMTEAGIRAGDALLWLVFSATTWLACRKLQLSQLACLFGAAVAPMAVTMNWVVMGQPETWVGMLTMALFVVLTRPLTVGSAATAAAIAGICFTVKPVYGLLLLPVAVALWHKQQDRAAGLRPVVALAATAAVAFMAPIIAVVAYLWTGSALQAYIDVQTRFNSEVHWLTMNKSATDVVWLAVGDFLSPRWLPRTLLCVLGLVLLLRRDTAKGQLLLATLVALYAGGAVQMKWYPYHFAAFDMLTLLPIAVCFDRTVAVTEARGARDTAFRLVCAAALLAWVLSKAIPTTLTTLRNVSASGLTQGLNAWQTASCVPDYCHPAIVEAAQVVKAHTQPSDKVFVFGFDTLIYFLADRASATGYGMSYPLLFPQIGYSAQARQEVARTLLSDPPAVIVLQMKDANTLYPRDSVTYFREWPELNDLAQTRYTEVFRNDRFIVLRHP